jgi:shikimate dehydrogenase
MGKSTSIKQERAFGLIGKKLEHSFSKSYFDLKFQKIGILASYSNFELKNEKYLADFLLEQVNQLNGFNVTIPYKQTIVPYLDELVGVAKQIQAVNTVRIKNHRLIGYNTDVFGFQQSIKGLLNPKHQKALVLGTGGASKSIIYALEDLGITTSLVSRNSTDKEQFSYKDLSQEILDSHQIIVNCTPVGTFPNVNQCPDIPYQFLNESHLVYDLVYNPKETLFLKKSKDQGTQIQNGLMMLHLQAERAWQIWNERI